MSLTSKCVPLFALVASIFVGCSSEGKEAPERADTVATLNEVQMEFSNAKTAVNNVNASLSKLQTSPDTKKAFADYSAAVSKSDYAAEKVADRWLDMRSRREEYQYRWDKEMSQITDPSVKAAIEQRRKALAAHVEEITAAAKEVRDAYQPYKTKTNEIQKALMLDPTPEAVATLKPAMNEAQKSAKVLNEKIDKMQSLLDNLSPEVKARRD